MLRHLALPFLVLAVTVQAEWVVSVDTSISRNHGKSLAAGLALSALVPGTGQAYLGERDRLKNYVWADVAGWSTVVISYLVGQSYLASAQSYASQYAGVVNPPRNPTFLDVMSRYRSRSGCDGQNSNPDSDESYDMAMIRAGYEVDAVYPSDASHTWDWGSSDNPESTQHMDHYGDILQRYRFSKVAFQVALGVVVLNRLVSVFDVLRIYRATASAPLTLNVVPLWSPWSAGASLQIGF
ncbi:MAG TPA: hypothetical protein VLM37_02640 [Fibrobacteraceae bacterium]|nr:hypothetical protein [Fibrobacteraceae bacterium]